MNAEYEGSSGNPGEAPEFPKDENGFKIMDPDNCDHDCQNCAMDRDAEGRLPGDEGYDESTVKRTHHHPGNDTPKNDGPVIQDITFGPGNGAESTDNDYRIALNLAKKIVNVALVHEMMRRKAPTRLQDILRITPMDTAMAITATLLTSGEKFGGLTIGPNLDAVMEAFDNENGKIDLDGFMNLARFDALVAPIKPMIPLKS